MFRPSEACGRQMESSVNLVYGALKTGDPKYDIPDPAYRSWGGFL